MTVFLSLALLWSCTPACAAAEEPPDYDFSAGLAAAVADFMAGHGMTEQNFCMAWRDLTDGTEYFVNGDRFSVAGSMYKLPLAMYCFDMLAEGGLSETELVGGYPLSLTLRMLIVNSSNDAALALRDRIFYNRREYRGALARYSGLDSETLPAEYYTENCISPRFLLNTLQTLYDRSEDYQTLIGYLKEASPKHYFCHSGSQTEVAHKYGSFEGWINDCGIVYAQRPFLLVAFTNHVPYAERTLGELRDLMEAYAGELAARDAAAPGSEPTPGIHPFIDVKESDWFFDVVTEVASSGLMMGVSQAEFAPYNPITRGMFATVLYRMEGEPATDYHCSFADVAERTYYSDAVKWASENQIISGYSVEQFAPNDYITREQIATIIYRYAKLKGYDESLSGELTYSDSSLISDYAVSAVIWNADHGIMRGTALDTFDPTGNATRAEAAAVLARLWHKAYDDA